MEAANYRYYIIGPQSPLMSERLADLIRFESIELARVSRVAITEEKMNAVTCLAYNVQPPCCIATPSYCGFSSDGAHGQLQKVPFSFSNMVKTALRSETEAYAYKGPHEPGTHHSGFLS